MPSSFGGLFGFSFSRLVYFSIVKEKSYNNIVMLLIVMNVLIILYNMYCLFPDFCSLATVCFNQSLILFLNFKSHMTVTGRCLHCLQRLKTLAGKGASQWFYMVLVLTMTPSTMKSWLLYNCNNFKTFFIFY